MNVLCVVGSPRKNGNTDILMNSVIEGAVAAGGATELVRLTELDISPCVACGGCEKSGRCVIHDDMQELYGKLDRAERVIIGSPIYFYGVTAQTKGFIDRCQALWCRKYLLRKRVRRGVVRKGFFLSVAATRGDRIFEGASLTVRYGLDAMDFSYDGELLIRGADHRGVVRDMNGQLERARDFGMRIVG